MSQACKKISAGKRLRLYTQAMIRTQQQYHLVCGCCRFDVQTNPVLLNIAVSCLALLGCRACSYMAGVSIGENTTQQYEVPCHNIQLVPRDSDESTINTRNDLGMSMYEHRWCFQLSTFSIRRAEGELF